MSERPPGASSGARILGWVWWGFWLAVLLAQIGFVLASRHVASQLARKRAALARSGVVLSIGSLVPRVAPGAANAAELYRRAFAQLALSPSQRRLILGTQDFLHWSPPKPPADWTPSDWQSIKQALAANPEYLRLVEKAAHLRNCAFPVRWHRGCRTDQQDLPSLLAAGLMLRARASMLAREGNAEGALEEAGLLLRMADHAQAEPALISQHTGYCLQEMAVGVIESALAQGGGQAATLRCLLDQLHRPHLVSRSRRALQGEAAIYDLPCFASRAQQPALACPEQPRRPWAARLFPGLASALDELGYLTALDRVYRAFSLPWAAAEAQARSADAQVRNLPDWRGWLTKRVMPPMLPELLHRQQTMARLATAAVGVAACLHWQEQARYPRSLAELARVLPDPPRDPFTGKALRYLSRETGFLVYSLGPDGKDDGGRAPSGQLLRGLLRDAPPDPARRYDLAFVCSHEPGGRAPSSSTSSK